MAISRRLPSSLFLRRVAGFGDLEAAVADLRRARPDLEVAWTPAERPPGERVGPVFLRAPTEGLPDWWLREDLTELLGTHTNADAEKRLRAVLAADEAALLARLDFDTEGDAVCVYAKREDDIRAVARIIERLAGKSARQ
jgi:hypothetical protein